MSRNMLTHDDSFDALPAETADAAGAVIVQEG